MISVILIKSGKRNNELDKIIFHLNQIKEINEILIHDNTKKNVFTYGRFLTTLKAKNKIIYTQDDDCLVHNFSELLKIYNEQKDPIIINSLKPKFFKAYPGPETLLGWGSLFPIESIQVFDLWKNKWGEDYLLHRGADRIFTTLNKSFQIPANLTEFPSATDRSIGLCYREDYQKIIGQVRTRLQSLQVLTK